MSWRQIFSWEVIPDTTPIQRQRKWAWKEFYKFIDNPEFNNNYESYRGRDNRWEIEDKSPHRIFHLTFYTKSPYGGDPDPHDFSIVYWGDTLLPIETHVDAEAE